MKYQVDLWGYFSGDEMPRLLESTVTTVYYLDACIVRLLARNNASYIKIRRMNDEESTSSLDWYGHATAHGV